MSLRLGILKLLGDEDHSTPSDLLAVGISNASHSMERDSFRVAANQLLGPYASSTAHMSTLRLFSTAEDPFDLVCLSFIKTTVSMNAVPLELGNT